MSFSQLQQRFERYHADNPEVYNYYKKFAEQAKRAGRKRLSIALLTERIRWELTIATKSDDGFKISNNHAAFYARALSKLPEFTGLFQLKQQRVFN